MGIKHDTRRESYQKVDILTRQKVILQAFETYGAMTARECARHLGFVDLNGVKPRITELCQKGALEAICKEKDLVTNRSVAVYRVRPTGPGPDAQLRLSGDPPP